MKLNSKYLKELILEVLDEATRRDFLKGTVGLAGLAATGGLSDSYADEGPALEIDQSLSDIPVSKEEGKKALDRLRQTPDMEYYTVAPVQDSITGIPYAYVDMNALYDEADQIPELDMAISDAEAFYQDWTVVQIYKYVFGQLAFWGTFRDENDPLNRQMTKTVPSNDRWGRDVDVQLLPVAWTVSMDIWMTKMNLLEAKLKQYPEQRAQILASQGMSEVEYAELKENYNQLLNSINNSPTIHNPNYKQEKK